ncbi:MAG: winged helix-turn-helix transcriptional regulator [Ruminococcus sp.]|nr:winged helix-turn-helix transcriptional regulator [Ruminococcus sp.]
MAEAEQIEKIVRLMDEAVPEDMMKKMDSFKLGIGAVMRVLAANGGKASSGLISGTLRISTARVAVLTKKMSARGLIEKCRDEHDARVTVIRLTEQGQQMAREMKDNMYRDVGILIDRLGMERLLDFIGTSKEIKELFSNKDCCEAVEKGEEL